MLRAINTIRDLSAVRGITAAKPSRAALTSLAMVVSIPTSVLLSAMSQAAQSPSFKGQPSQSTSAHTRVSAPTCANSPTAKRGSATAAPWPAIAAFTPSWRHVAVIWAVFFAFSLAIGRILSLIVDGMPSRRNPLGDLPETVAAMLLAPPAYRPGGGGTGP